MDRTVLLEGAAGSPSNTMSPGLRSTSIPSGIFTYPSVWPQQTWVEKWGVVPLGLGEEVLDPYLKCG